jgi:hypothetical protein
LILEYLKVVNTVFMRKSMVYGISIDAIFGRDPSASALEFSLATRLSHGSRKKKKEEECIKRVM